MQRHRSGPAPTAPARLLSSPLGQPVPETAPAGRASRLVVPSPAKAHFLGRLIALLLAGALIQCFFAADSDARMLSFEERVAAQKAIEQVYWNHRIWPKENPGAKPPLSAVISDEQIQARVEDYLKKSNALEAVWQRPIGHEQLQAEMDRMAANTHAPEVLRELFEALGNDPGVIAEVLAREALADRAIRSAYARDDRFHGALRRSAEAELAGCRDAACMKALRGDYEETTSKRMEDGVRPSREPSVRYLDRDEWRAQLVPIRRSTDGSPRANGHPLSSLEETDEGFVVTAVLSESDVELTTVIVRWRKTTFDAWWTGQRSKESSAVTVSTESYVPAAITSGGCLADAWVPTSQGANDPPKGQVLGWTGTEMLVYSGPYAGARYLPSTDTWTPASTLFNFWGTGVWSGSEFVTWYSRYNPSSDTWRLNATSTMPEPRSYFSAVWSGAEMIVWGGSGQVAPPCPEGCGLRYKDMNTGSRYNPSADTWQNTSTLNAPSLRESHTAIWDPSIGKMIVWGGLMRTETACEFFCGFFPCQGRAFCGYDTFELNSGGRYDPATDSWTPTSLGPGCPSARYGHVAVSAGSEMIIWGGSDGGLLNTGSRYYSPADTWIPMRTPHPVLQLAPRSGAAAVWTGSDMIIWGGHYYGGYYNTGAIYHRNLDPDSDPWEPTPMTNVPSPRAANAVWTGTEMIVWGGSTNDNTGGRLCYGCAATATVYRDADGDGFGDAGQPQSMCAGQVPPGYVTNTGDCDDTNPAIPPTFYRDADGDGFGDPSVVTRICGAAPPGYVAGLIDCNDADPSIHPGALESTCNSIDDNCNGQTDEVSPVSFVTRAQLGTATNPYAVAIGDVNADGKPDLAVANLGSNTVSVFQGDGFGGFAVRSDFATGSAPISVVVEDLNGDGKRDLVTANNGSSSVSVLINNGAGGFARTDFAAGTEPHSVAIRDVNGDLKPDMAVANYAANTVSVRLGNGTGGFGARTDFATDAAPIWVEIEDVSSDGKPDLLVANNVGNTLSILLGNGAGSFGAKTDFLTGTHPHAIAIEDFNGDSKRDMAVTNNIDGTFSVLLGNGNGTFGPKTDFATGASPYGIVTGDFSGDGEPDLAIANDAASTVSVLLGTGSGAFGQRTDFSTGTVPIGLAVGDLSKDGRPDLAVANNGSNTLTVLLGAGFGSFASRTDLPTSLDPYGIAVDDASGDSKADVTVTNFGSNSVSVFRSDGAGGFTPASSFGTGSGPVAVVVRDVSGDGRPDLVVANNTANTVSVLLGNGAGSFAPRTDFPTGATPFQVASADVSGDGKPDLAAANYGANTVSVLLGNGTGGFAPKIDFATGTNPISVAIGDVSGDGKRDLVVANRGSNTVSVLLGNGTGSFGQKTDFATGNDPYRLELGDVNGDGNPDLAVPNTGDNTVSVLLGNGVGGFGARTDFAAGTYARTVAIGDLNLDGKPDLAVANYFGNTVSVLLGDGHGTFGSRTDFCTGVGPRGVAVGDLNGDGRVDLAATNAFSNTASVLFNTPNLVDVKPVLMMLPTSFELLAPRPNPSRGTCTFAFALPEAGRVRAEVFDLAGRRVARLANDEMLTPGLHSLTWNGRQSSGARLASGVYLVRVSTGKGSATRKLVIVSP